MNKSQRVLLMILDGWAHGPDPNVSAIAQAKTLFVDGLYDKYPNSELKTDGEVVGLPEGQMGNSEVGHMNIGAGRIVDQDLQRINKAISNGDIKQNEVLNQALAYARENNKKLHFMGLASDGGIHSHIDHLKGLCDYADEYGLQNVYVHAFTDGRDTDPKSGKGFIKELEQHIANKTPQLASVIGRYYAMDRDKRWERIKQAYDLLTEGKGSKTTDFQQTIQRSYEEDVTDEFLNPIVKTDEHGNPLATIDEGDAVICFNFRTDRCRQITQVFTQEDMPEQGMNTMPLHYVTMTNYDDTFKGVHILFDKPNLDMTLGEVLEKRNKTQLRIAETEKYPHVTYFFNGGRELQFEGEQRKVVPSPKVATYDLQPEMSAYEVRDEVNRLLEEQTPDFICLNFANPDMVGHTGVFDAAVKAVETIDNCAESVTQTALAHDYTIMITADHGNSDYLINDDGSPNTAHTKNPVPFFLLNAADGTRVSDGKLGDIAPTVLKLMGLDVPGEMTGKALVDDK